MTIEEEFFNKLYEVFEEMFPKGEKCKCGKKLSCRIRALMLNTYANLFFIEMKEKWQSELIKEIEKKRKSLNLLGKDIYKPIEKISKIEGFNKAIDEILEILKGYEKRKQKTKQKKQN